MHRLATPKPPPSPPVMKPARWWRVGLGLAFADVFIVASILSDPNDDQPPVNPLLNEQNVVARSGVYSTRVVVHMIEHENTDVAVTPKLYAPGIVSTLHGLDGDHITEVELPKLPPLEPTGTERCNSRGFPATHESGLWMARRHRSVIGPTGRRTTNSFSS
jgi:hypothetical protein